MLMSDKIRFFIAKCSDLHVKKLATPPLNTTPTLRPVLPPCSQLFSYPDYSLSSTADTTNHLINALEFTSPHPCVNDYLVYPPTNYDMTMNHIM